MKIRNHTHYVTADLRRIIARCADHELEAAHRRRVIVTVTYSRRKDSCSGHATIGGNWATVRINKHAPNPAAFALVTAHEFKHLRGWTHKQMKGRYSDDDTSRYAWAAGLPLAVKTPARKVRPTVDAKIAHARLMVKRATTRAKRAATLLRKWQRRVRLLERKATNAAIDALPIAAGGPA